LLVTFTAALVSVPAAAAKTPSPKTLYSALLTTTIPDSALPSGFTGAKTSYAQPSKTSVKYGAVGEVTVSVDGLDPNDAIAFTVFPDSSSALADLHHGIPSTEKQPGPVHGFSASVLLAYSVKGKNILGHEVTDGVSDAAAAVGNVLVQGVTTSADSTESGNVPAAISLLRAAVKYEQSLA